MSFRSDSKNLAHHSTLRQSAITETAMTTSEPGKSESKWVSLYGHDNVVERCEFTGKTSAGALLVVWLPDRYRTNGVPVRHRIERNFFGPRSRLGKNGGEALRIGDSDHSLQSAACLVVENRFERCDGEVECISNKSCDNIFRGNTFWECQGTLTLRHGHGCLVEHNVFLGNQRRETGGIRIIGERHRIVGNYLQGVMGDEARSAICLMSGQRDSPLNGYSPVRDCQILGNTLIDCRHGLTIGYADRDVRDTVPPRDCLLADNLVAGEAGTSLEFLSSGATLTWRGNILAGRAPAGSPTAGIRWNEQPTARAKPPTMERSDVGPVWNLAGRSDTRPES